MMAATERRAGFFSPKGAGHQSIVGRAVSAGEVFGADDWAELESLRDKLMPEGAAAALRRARTNIMMEGADEESKALYASEYLDEYGRVSERDYQRLKAVMEKAHAAKAAVIDPDRYAAIRAAAEQGLMRKDEADKLVYREQGESKYKASSKAREIFFHVTKVVNELQSHTGAMLSDEDKARAVERWKAESDFNAAKEQFRDRANGASVHVRADLYARYPEFR